MQGKEQIYFLVDPTGKTYRIEGGLVVTKSTPAPLAYTPDGWQDISIAWERNTEDHGINRNFSLPLGFVLDAKRILRHIINTYNFEKRVSLLIKRQQLHIDDDQYYFWHKYLYKGDLDLTTYENTEDKMTVSIMEGGLIKALKAFSNVEYEFPMSEGDVDVLMDGIEMRHKLNFSFVENITNRNGYVTAAYINREGYERGLVGNTQYNEQGVDIESPNYILLSTDKIDNVKISGTIKVKKVSGEGSNSNFTLAMRLSNSTDVELIPPTSINNNVEYTFSFDKSFNVPEGSLRIYMYYIGSFTIVPPEIQFSETNFSVEYIYRAPASTIKAYRPFTLFSKLIEKITGSANNAESNLLEEYKHLVITCGDAIRGIEEATFRTSLNQFKTSFYAILCAGMGIIGNKVVFEEREEFYQEGDVIHLGKAKNVVDRYASDMLINTVAVGYGPQNYEDVNGRQEFNNTAKFSTSIQSVNKEYTAISEYRADAIGMELIRINLEGKTTTDDKGDKEGFVINIADTPVEGVYPLRRENYSSIEGILSTDSIFNIEDLTPKRILLKHGKWLRGLLHGFEGEKLIFQTTDKNRELKTVLNGETIDEDADVPVISLDKPYFLPRVFELECEMPEVAELLEENPNRCFSFEHPNGQIYKGFNLKIGISPSSKTSDKIRLLMTADTDLKTLING